MPTTKTVSLTIFEKGWRNRFYTGRLAFSYCVYGSILFLTLLPFMSFPLAGACLGALTWGIVLNSIWYTSLRIVMPRLYRCLEPTDLTCCLKCEHSLVGLPDGGKCPECGETFNLQTLHQDWTDRIGGDGGATKPKVWSRWVSLHNRWMIIVGLITVVILLVIYLPILVGEPRWE